jgi:hypothetical protein
VRHVRPMVISSLILPVLSLRDPKSELGDLVLRWCYGQDGESIMFPPRMSISSRRRRTMKLWRSIGCGFRKGGCRRRAEYTGWMGAYRWNDERRSAAVLSKVVRPGNAGHRAVYIQTLRIVFTKSIWYALFIQQYFCSNAAAGSHLSLS